MQTFSRVYGLETVSLRYFNVFGPYQDQSSPYSGVIAKFISKMLAGESPTIYGDGEQSRDFTYVDNAVQANLLAMTAPTTAAAGQSYNIGIGRQISLNATFDALQQIIGFQGSASYAAPRTGDVKHSRADISRARQALQYSPQVGFEEGLRKTVDWYKGNHVNPKAVAAV